MGDGSDLQLPSSFDTHAAQIPRRAAKICFPPLLLLAYGAAPEGMQRAMLEGRSGRAPLLSGGEQQDEGAMGTRVMPRSLPVSQCWWVATTCENSRTKAEPLSRFLIIGLRRERAVSTRASPQKWRDML